MDGAVLVHLLLILLVGFLFWNNITEVVSAPANTKLLKQKAITQDIFPMCENVKKMCMAGVPDCLGFSLLDQRLIGRLSESGQLLESDQQQRVVCCLECKKGQKKLVPIHDPCKPTSPCGSHGKCKVLSDINNINDAYVCDCFVGWTGDNCDKRLEYDDIRKENCDKYSCKMPNVCVHRDELRGNIQSTLKKTEAHGHVMNDTDKLKRLVEVVLKTSSRGNDTVCLCSSGKRGLRCDLPCKAGTWGLYCLENCDKNCLKPKCGSKDGKCKCKRGYIQNEAGVCELSTPSEANCQAYCKHGHCSGKQCICKYAQGVYCDTKCSNVKPHPRYGEQCEKPCGGCTRLPCDRETGDCVQPVNPKAKLCLDPNYFTGVRCDLISAVVGNATMIFRKINDSVPDDEFETALARIENDQVKLNSIKEKIKEILRLAVPTVLLVAVAGVSGVAAGSVEVAIMADFFVGYIKHVELTQKAFIYTCFAS